MDFIPKWCWLREVFLRYDLLLEIKLSEFMAQGFGESTEEFT